MSAVLTQDATPATSAAALNDAAVELGIWLSSLESFALSGPGAFFAANAGDRSREARILHSGLLRSAMLTAILLDPQAKHPPIPGLKELAKELRDIGILCEPAVHAKPLSSAEYNVLRETVGRRLRAVPVVKDLTAAADAAGEAWLPQVLIDFARAPQADAGEAELAIVLPRFAQVLRYLEVVGGMLERDEPLKPAILIFSRVNEMIFELTTFINSRLERFGDTDTEMFATLDAASYTASMELKKVYSQELAGAVDVRPAPSVYARTETAYALLHDGFRLILGGFAKTVDPEADLFRIFPEMKAKREQSVVLVNELRDLIKTVTTAENDPSDARADALRTAIREFMLEPAEYLFYKDTETVERFVEEIRSTTKNEDLVPLLHRFGAYLDTLLGQVRLRSVLADQVSF